jgi:LmbE family N-acetylglucosaminyl deacetylase
LVLVPHPDDPEYGCAAAVAKWTAAGKTVHYALASRGEVGIEGIPPALRTKIAKTISALAPEMVVTIYGGAEWAPGAPNQRDHIEFSNAVTAAYDSLADPPRWIFECGPDITHGEVVDGYLEAAVASDGARRIPLRARPRKARRRAARIEVDAATPPRPEFGDRRTVSFILRREAT